MMLAPEFSRAQTARISDFASSSSERGLFWMKPRRTKSRSDNQEDDTDGPSRPDLSTETLASSSRWKATPPIHSTRRVPSALNPPSKDHRLVRGNLIAQFAANNGKSLADACEIISVRPGPSSDEDEGESSGKGEFVGKNGGLGVDEAVPKRLVDGVDLNCVSK